MDQQNRRRLPRVKTDIPARLSVLIPEDTFSPPSMECVVSNLSERGAMVSVTIPEQLYSKLLQRVRHCRIYFSADTELPDRIVGKAVWIQPSKNSTISLGLFFEDCPEPTITKLRQYLDTLVASQP